MKQNLIKLNFKLLKLIIKLNSNRSDLNHTGRRSNTLKYTARRSNDPSYTACTLKLPKLHVISQKT